MVGFGASVQSMVNQSLQYAYGFFADFWPVVAVFVGFWALGYIIGLFRS